MTDSTPDDEKPAAELPAVIYLPDDRQLQRAVDLLREQFAAPVAAVHAALDRWRQILCPPWFNRALAEIEEPTKAHSGNARASSCGPQTRLPAEGQRRQ